MVVTFIRWSLTPEDRTPVAINPKRVDCLEHWSPEYPKDHPLGPLPACTRIVMQGKQTYLVQGSVDKVAAELNYDEPEFMEK